MGEVTLSGGDGDGWVLTGDLDFSSVPALWAELRSRIMPGEPLTLSLKGVDHANSAGLVLLIEVIDAMRKNGAPLQLRDIPGELLDLARMSNCEELICAQA